LGGFRGGIKSRYLNFIIHKLVGRMNEDTVSADPYEIHELSRVNSLAYPVFMEPVAE
jgi:hypothetical protein